jgi:hypothetical protein
MQLVKSTGNVRADGDVKVGSKNNIMNTVSKYSVIALVLFLFSSCKKEAAPPEAHPQMTYINLNNQEVGQGNTKALDLNGDGRIDIAFGTTLVGDPFLKRDRLLFEVKSNIGTYLLNNEQEETPPLTKGTKIGMVYTGFEWNEISSLMLAEKDTFESGEVGWDGIWKSASHKFLPLSVKSGDLLYFGWIELSFNRTTEKIILHQAALSKEGGKEIKAGM